ncbi:MAG: type II secretion system F family protein [Deltaproteobacteria bacterium]|nr:type II secretion system F family protein [Deltaproteobacteria bacterium]MBW2362803.1 type II secretion system F family protein [Deltaproteobacteria bacterium]
MPIYLWKARTRQGTIKKGELEAANDEAVLSQLRAQMLMPVTVKKKPKDISEYLPFLRPGITTKDLVIFTRQFATMIDAGLPLVQCLQILGDQQENPTFKLVIQEVRADVEQGSTFAEALAKHEKPFDSLYTNLVHAGEVGGILDTILNRLAVYLEKADALARKVKGAMVYPGTVLVVAVGVVVLMLVKIIPTFEKMFADFGGELPGPTKMVVAMSHWMQDWLVVSMVGIAITVFSYLRARKVSLRFRRATDALYLKVPVFGSLLRKVAVARFSRTLGTMIASGVPILDGLDIVAKTAGNVVVEEALNDVKAAISEGKTIAEPLAETDVFPGMVVQMIAVGEETGAMESMLSKIADFYDDEVDAAVDALTAMLEPAMMVVLGGTVGGLLIAMYLPIFKIAETIG